MFTVDVKQYNATTTTNPQEAQETEPITPDAKCPCPLSLEEKSVTVFFFTIQYAIKPGYMGFMFSGPTFTGSL